MKITFLGAGAYGKALAHIAQYNGHEIQFYDPYKFPENTLEGVVKPAEIIVFVAPTNTAEDLLPKLPEDTPLICASKGFLSLKPFEKFKNFSALGGAAFAEDLEHKSSRDGSELTLTTSSELSEKIFSTEYLRIEYTPDTFGILLCGALKNIYAIGAGIHTKNRPADLNPRITTSEDFKYIRPASLEICAILSANGVDPEIFQLSCGLRDFSITATEASRNYRFGQEIKNHPEGTKLETVDTVEGVDIIKHLDNYPDFKIPKDAKIIREIIKKVKNAT